MIYNYNYNNYNNHSNHSNHNNHDNNVEVIESKGGMIALYHYYYQYQIDDNVDYRTFLFSLLARVGWELQCGRCAWGNLPYPMSLIPDFPCLGCLLSALWTISCCISSPRVVSFFVVSKPRLVAGLIFNPQRLSEGFDLECASPERKFQEKYFNQGPLSNMVDGCFW